jgi:hypothetical protein
MHNHLYQMQSRADASPVVGRNGISTGEIQDAVITSCYAMLNLIHPGPTGSDAPVSLQLVIMNRGFFKPLERV